jgi:hypothetical protein
LIEVVKLQIFWRKDDAGMWLCQKVEVIHGILLSWGITWNWNVVWKVKNIYWKRVIHNLSMHSDLKCIWSEFSWLTEKYYRRAHLRTVWTTCLQGWCTFLKVWLDHIPINSYNLCHNTNFCNRIKSHTFRFHGSIFYWE